MSRAIEVVGRRCWNLDFHRRAVERIPEWCARSGQAARGFDEHDPAGAQHRCVDDIDDLALVIFDGPYRAPLTKACGTHAREQSIEKPVQIQSADDVAQLIDVCESVQGAYSLARQENGERLIKVDELFRRLTL